MKDTLKMDLGLHNTFLSEGCTFYFAFNVTSIYK